MVAPFAKVTETNGRVHWVNLTHVRELIVKPAKGDRPVLTEINIDNNAVASVFTVVETPEQILAQTIG
ncbi:hypothetical protein [Brevundimonas sp.]|uniref:hypothetical protein n=1 Tax=Brevundimonas sp. TaxID=1871086 RepID=UPI003D0EB6F6